MKQLINEIFHTNNYTLEKMNKGLTNHNYLLTVHDKQYVVRLPRKDSAHLTNRHLEKKISEIAKELDVETIYFNEKNGIKITKFVDNLYEYEECPYSDKIERCARMMKTLHSLPKTTSNFDVFNTLQIYQNHITKPLYDLSCYNDKITKVKQFKNEKVLCHNDFVSGNILFGKKRDYLIDYEYGGNNDPLFDVISFLSENKIFNPKERLRFYHAYFNEINDSMLQQMYLWELFQNVLWCSWAMMMYETRKESIYQQIASDKYQALKDLDALYTNIQHMLSKEE